MELDRMATPQEEKLLDYLVKNAKINFPVNWKENLLVRPMNDGEMGGLYLFPNGKINTNRKFGRQVSEFRFTDKDGVEVIASLYVDTEGQLFELDIWKTDFGKLVEIPDIPL